MVAVPHAVWHTLLLLLSLLSSSTVLRAATILREMCVTSQTWLDYLRMRTCAQFYHSCAPWMLNGVSMNVTHFGVCMCVCVAPVYVAYVYGSAYSTISISKRT